MNGTITGFRFAALLLGLLFASCVPTRKDEDLVGSGTEMGNVVGSIYTPDNQPAAGIQVSLYPNDHDNSSIKSTVTDASGNYAFKDVVGTYSLFVLDGEGNGLKVDSIQASLSDSIDLERRTLAPLASISGVTKVVGVRSADAKVMIYLTQPYSIFEFNPNTSFLISDLPAGKYWVSFTYGLSDGASIPITLAPGQTLNLDTVTLFNKYSVGLSIRDTLKISSSQLPYLFDDKLALDVGEVDSVFWTLNGARYPFERDGRFMILVLDSGSLQDTGYNRLEMQLYLPDTTVFHVWFIDLDDDAVTPWARQVVQGVFIKSEIDTRIVNEGMPLGTFQILNHRSLSESELNFWNGTPVPDGDTALPSQIKIPMNRFEFGNPWECGGLGYNMEPELFPGDTVTFITEPNSSWGGQSFRIRNNENYSDFTQLAWFDQAAWPLAKYHAEMGGSRDLRLVHDTLHVRLNLNLSAHTGEYEWGCAPLSRAFAIGADKIPHEYVAMPDGMTAGNLLLHYRAGLPSGLFTEALADTGEYVFIDSTGYGIVGHNKERRVVQLSSQEVSELRALLASLPAVIPIEWHQDFLADRLEKNIPDYMPSLLGSNYLLSGGRGCILAGEPRSRPAPEAKLNLFKSVEGWLRSHNFLE